jgi:excisionase family DNA binding protein
VARASSERLIRRDASTGLRIQGVAEALGQHPATVYRHVAAGEIGSVRLGSSPRAPIRIPASAFEEFLHHERNP